MSTIFDFPQHDDNHNRKPTVTYGSKKRTPVSQKRAFTSAAHKSSNKKPSATRDDRVAEPPSRDDKIATTASHRSSSVPADTVDDTTSKNDRDATSRKRKRPVQSHAASLHSAKPAARSTDAAVSRHLAPREVESELGPSQPSVRPTRTPERKHKINTPRSVSMTPKQQDLWSQLLEPDASKPTISELTNNAARAPTTTQHKKVRLIDRLKSESQRTSETAKLGDDASETEEDIDILENPSRSFSQPPRQHSSLDSFKTQSQRSDTASGPQRTYAQTRSYLQDDDDLETDLLTSIPLDSPVDPRTAASQPGDGDDDSDQAHTQSIRNIHELRAAGANARFTDDVEALLQDVKMHSKPDRSRRRGALMDLATRFEDKAFVNRFLESGYGAAFCHDECSAVAESRGIDPIGDTILMICMLRILRVPASRSMAVSIQKSAVLTWVSELADSTEIVEKLVKDKKSNVAKASQADILAFMEEVRTVELFDGTLSPTVLTRGAISLACADAILGRLSDLPATDSMYGAETISVATKLVAIAFDADAKDDWCATRALSILEREAIAVRTTNAILSEKWNREIVPRIVLKWPASLGTGAGTIATAEITLLLRLCLNLSNNDAEACDMFARHEVIASLLDIVAEKLQSADRIPSAEGDTGLDVLLLALGLVINLVEFSERARTCVASTNTTALTRLVQAFEEGQEKALLADSLEQSRTNVARGYLAVFLGNLCLDTKAKEVIQSGLADGDMGRLARAISEFVQYHEQVDQNAGAESWKKFTDRLMAVIDHIQ